MSKQPLLTEATQKRLLLLAGMSHFSDEVLTESKKDGIPTAPNYMGGEKKAKSAPSSKKEGMEADCAEDKDKKKIFEEIPPEEGMEAAPVSPTAPAPTPEAAPPVAGAVPGSADVDFKAFAAEFAKFLTAQGHQITLTVDGEDVSAQAEAPVGEEDFGDIGGEGEGGGDEFGAEPPATEEPAPAPEPTEEEPSPKFESKEKRVAKLVYEEVLRTLTAQAGINLAQARKNGKVQVNVAPKPKK